MSSRPACLRRRQPSGLTRDHGAGMVDKTRLDSGRTIMTAAPMRAFLGFIAGAISLLAFHQGLLEIFHLAGAGGPAWSVQPVPPFNIPRVVDLCFWAGLWGMVFGLL